MALGVGVGVGVGAAGFNTGLRSGLGAAFEVTPLFQTSFEPDLIQVNFFPAADAVIPALVHLAPALGVAAKEGAVKSERHSKTTTVIRVRVTPQRYQSVILIQIVDWSILEGCLDLDLTLLSLMALKMSIARV